MYSMYSEAIEVRDSSTSIESTEAHVLGHRTHATISIFQFIACTMNQHSIQPPHHSLHAACITSATHFIAASRTNQHMLNGSYRGELPLYLFRFMFSELNVFRGGYGYIGNSRNSMEMNVCIFTEFLESIQSNKYTLTVWLGWRPKFGFQLDA